MKGNRDGYLVKLNSTCSNILKSTYIGGSNADDINSIILDSNNNIYAVGISNSTDFPVTGDAYRTSSSGNNDCVVFKLDSTFSNLVFSTYLGGGSDEYSSSINIDSKENLYITGSTSSSNFPVSSNPVQATRAGGSDLFISKINSLGTTLLYSSFFGGTGNEVNPAAVLSDDNSLIITSYTNSNDLTVSDRAYQRTSAGSDDALLAKFNGLTDDFPVINIGTVSGSPFCKGTEFHVPYTISGSLESSNKFILQLSNSDGLFSNPVNLDTLQSNTSGTIISHIPLTALPGFNYRVRIISDSPVVNSSRNNSALVINDCISSKIVNIKLAMTGLWNGTKHSFAVVAVELRKGSTLLASTLSDRKAALVDSLGNVSLDFKNLSDGLYWIVVRTHGYLPLGSSEQINLNTLSPVIYDFTTSSSKAAGGTNAVTIHNPSNIWMMKIGDLNGDRKVNSSDVNLYVLPNNSSDLRFIIPLP